MPQSIKEKKKLSSKLSPSLFGVGIGFIVSMSVMIYSYNYAISGDPQITNFLHYLVQKQYRILQFIVSLFPIPIGYFWGRGREEKTQLKAVAQEKTRLYQEVVAKQKTLDQLMYRISQSHEEERRRISRELHDGIAQNLSAMIISLDFLKKKAKGQSQSDFNELEDLIKENIVELRKIINNLSPTTLDSLGLIPTLERNLSQFEKENKIKTILKTDINKRLPSIAEIASFRITQEALNNIKKHAQAQEIIVNIEKSNGNVKVAVKDDGKGFDIKKVKEAQKFEGEGFGLTGMKERTESLGGKLNIITKPGEGTEITASIPLTSPKGIRF